MTISSRVQQQFFTPTGLLRSDAIISSPHTLLDGTDSSSRPGTPTTSSDATLKPPSPPPLRTKVWTPDEHERFLRGLEQFPRGPWKCIAAVVGTKTTRQTMTHSQKYREKMQRRQRLVGTLVEPSSLQSLQGAMPPPNADNKAESCPLGCNMSVNCRHTIKPFAWGHRGVVHFHDDPEFHALLDTLHQLDDL